MFKKLLALFGITENVIFKRLNCLFNSLYLCDEIIGIKFIKKEIDNDDTGEIIIEFSSDLGTVRISIEKKSNFFIELSYANYAGSFVFTLKALPHNLIVTPELGQYLFAKDIDLALYELEQHIQNNTHVSENLLGDVEMSRLVVHFDEVSKLERGRFL